MILPPDRIASLSPRVRAVPLVPGPIESSDRARNRCARPRPPASARARVPRGPWPCRRRARFEPDPLVLKLIAPTAPTALERLPLGRRQPIEVVVLGVQLGLSGQDKADKTILQFSTREAEDALAIDPNSVRALHALAFSHGNAVFLGIAADRDHALQEATWAATQAIELNSADALGYALRAVGAMHRGQWDRYPEALADARRAHEMNPNDTFMLGILGLFEAWSGETERGIQHLHQAMRLNPRETRLYFTYTMLASACFCGKRYTDDIVSASRALRDRPQMVSAHTEVVLALVGMGEIGKAKTIFKTCKKQRQPNNCRSRLEGNMWAFGPAED